MKPVRLQLSRRKGFNLQAHSLAVNGLPAKNVARPSRLGNSFKVGIDGTAAECAQKFRADIERRGIPLVRKALQPFRDHNFACWCKLGEPCHADVLLEIANAEPSA